MSGEGPESIPTSADRRSKRPVKKRALTPVSAQAAGLDALFAKPDQAIRVPVSADVARLRGTGNGGAPPEIISNVQGSSSGAGSGEFHVYKASRRREYARLRQLDEEAQRDRDSTEFAVAKREREARDDEKTKRNREKREKAKARKANKGGKKSGGGGDGPTTTAKSAISSSAAGTRNGDDNDDDDDSDSNTNGNGAAAANGNKKGDDDDDGTLPSANSLTKGANGGKMTMTAMRDPVPAAEGPGLLIQDDDD